MLNNFQDAILQNKLRRHFNVTDVGKEIILITEELGELCDAYLNNDEEEIIDAFGDIMVYGLGLSAMFEWDASKIIPQESTYNSVPYEIAYILPYVGRSAGMLAKIYKRSNKTPVDALNSREEFQKHVGDLLGYCRDGLRLMGQNESHVLESIVTNNNTRTHRGHL